MLHAAAMLAGLVIIWFALLGRALTPEYAALGAGVAVLVLLAAWRLGGVGRSFLLAPNVLAVHARSTGAVMRGALATLRAALAADVTLHPALVRVRTRASGRFARAALADAISAAPGSVVIDSDADGYLVHVQDEESRAAADLASWEARVLSVVAPEAEA